MRTLATALGLMSLFCSQSACSMVIAAIATSDLWEIRTGAPQHQVRKLLGEPDATRTTPGGTRVEVYTLRTANHFWNDVGPRLGSPGSRLPAIGGQKHGRSPNGVRG